MGFNFDSQRKWGCWEEFFLDFWLICAPKWDKSEENVKGLLKKNLLFQNWKCHAYSNGKGSTVPESLIITALETVFLPKKFTRKRVQEMGEVTLVARKYC